MDRTFLAVAATFSAVKPYSLKSRPAGAEAPKWSMHTVAPSRPTYLCQPKLEAAYTATRARTAEGITDS